MRSCFYSAHGLSSNMSLVCVMMVLVSCASAQKSQWDSLDYSSVYRKAAEKGEYDTNYTPSYTGCMDDDLIKCDDSAY